jgi:hypothetical protein
MFEVRSAGIKGLGIFATTTIKRGTRILAERPVFGIHHDQKPKDVYPSFRKLSASDRVSVLGLSAHATRELALLRWTHVIWYSLASSMLPTISRLREHKTILDIFRSNAFSLNATSRYSEAIFPRIARLNHECIPNSQANFDDKADAMHVHALRDITDQEEITLSYLDDDGQMTTSERHRMLQPYGFVCACPICTKGSLQAMRSIERRQAMYEATRGLQGEGNGRAETPSRNSELQVLLKIIELMLREGLVGRELSARYLVAADWHYELKDLAGALECALRGLKVDEYTVGKDSLLYCTSEASVHRYHALLHAKSAATSGDEIL